MRKIRSREYVILLLIIRNARLGERTLLARKKTALLLEPEFTSQFRHREFISIHRVDPAPTGSTSTFQSLLSSWKVLKRS